MAFDPAGAFAPMGGIFSCVRDLARWVAGFAAAFPPEAALSPSRQLVLLRHMHLLIEDGSQFLIATHSPILLAFPGIVARFREMR